MTEEEHEDYLIFDMQGIKGAYVKYFYYVDGKMYRHEVTRLTHLRNPFYIGDKLKLTRPSEVKDYKETWYPDEYKGVRVEPTVQSQRIIYRPVYDEPVASFWPIEDDLL